MTNRDEYINGLRQLADWLDANSQAEVPYVADISMPLTDNASVERYAAATGLEVVYDKDGNASATASFGSLTYRAYGYADWDSWRVQHHAKRARAWANSNGMDIVPADGGETA